MASFPAAKGPSPASSSMLRRNEGCGRAARPGFQDPQWVDGELLVLDGGSKDITNGAELGFVWEVPSERRFLILLGKVRLPLEMLNQL